MTEIRYRTLQYTVMYVWRPRNTHGWRWILDYGYFREWDSNAMEWDLHQREWDPNVMHWDLHHREWDPDAKE